jgi:hypothetical protein
VQGFSTQATTIHWLHLIDLRSKTGSLTIDGA